MSEETRTEFDPSRYIFTDPGVPTAIRSRTVLPARRENFEVTTADGKRLVGVRILIVVTIDLKGSL